MLHAQKSRSNIKHIFAHSKKNSKWLYPPDSGALGILFDEKTEGEKSHGKFDLHIQLIPSEKV
jgi:hypothetical protein